MLGSPTQTLTAPRSREQDQSGPRLLELAARGRQGRSRPGWLRTACVGLSTTQTSSGNRQAEEGEDVIPHDRAGRAGGGVFRLLARGVLVHGGLPPSSWPPLDVRAPRDGPQTSVRRRG